MEPGDRADMVETAFGIRTAVVLSSDAALRRETRVSLEATGLRVREMESLDALREVAARQSFDLVLYDVRDEPRYGRSFARELRRPVFPAHLGVLVLSPASETPRALEALEQGADDYLSVPFHQVVFGARVRATLNRSILYQKYRLGIEALRESRHELATAIESMAHAFALFGPDGSLRLANQRFFAMYPATAAPEDRLTLAGLLRSVANIDGALDERDGSPNRTEPARWAEACVEAIREGRPRLIRTTAQRVYEIRGSVTPNGGLVTAHEDTTDRVRVEERLRHLALHDPLTGLANRVQFEEAVGRALRGARRADEAFALLYMDLDGFKRVNDELGHAAGDELLAHVARLLRETVREGDLVARLGGDEFAVLSRNAATEREVVLIGERLRARLGTRYPAGDRGIPIGLSIGAVIERAPHDSVGDVKTLVARADAAMYDAKRAKEPRVVFYDASRRPPDQSNLGGRFS
jgi:diguanylate cyclase (GGDEF)-like protein